MKTIPDFSIAHSFAKLKPRPILWIFMMIFFGIGLLGCHRDHFSPGLDDSSGLNIHIQAAQSHYQIHSGDDIVIGVEIHLDVIPSSFTAYLGLIDAQYPCRNSKGQCTRDLQYSGNAGFSCILPNNRYSDTLVFYAELITDEYTETAFDTVWVNVVRDSLAGVEFEPLFNRENESTHSYRTN